MSPIYRISVVSLCLGFAVSCMTGCGNAPEETGMPTGIPVKGTSVDNSKHAELLSETIQLLSTRQEGSSDSIPEDMPVYTGAKIGDTMGSVEADSLMVLLQTSDPIDKVTAFYKEHCSAAGWTESGTMVDPAGAVMQLLAYTKDDRKLSVAIVKNQTENVVDITMTSAKLDSTRPESAGSVTTYYPGTFRQPSSGGNKTDSP